MTIGTLTENEIYNLPTTECSCEKCKEMCKISRPCWGTPKDIKKIIDSGFGDKLMLDWYSEDDLYIEIITPALVDHECKKAPFWPKGLCCLLENDLCKIHDIKPIEGKVVDHSDTGCAGDLHYSLVDTWNTPEGKELVKNWKDKYFKSE